MTPDSTKEDISVSKEKQSEHNKTVWEMPFSVVNLYSTTVNMVTSVQNSLWHFPIEREFLKDSRKSDPLKLLSMAVSTQAKWSEQWSNYLWGNWFEQSTWISQTQNTLPFLLNGSIPPTLPHGLEICLYSLFRLHRQNHYAGNKSCVFLHFGLAQTISFPLVIINHISDYAKSLKF